MGWDFLIYHFQNSPLYVFKHSSDSINQIEYVIRETTKNDAEELEKVEQADQKGIDINAQIQKALQSMLMEGKLSLNDVVETKGDGFIKRVKVKAEENNNREVKYETDPITTYDNKKDFVEGSQVTVDSKKVNAAENANKAQKDQCDNHIKNEINNNHNNNINNNNKYYIY